MTLLHPIHSFSKLLKPFIWSHLTTYKSIPFPNLLLGSPEIVYQPFLFAKLNCREHHGVGNRRYFIFSSRYNIYTKYRRQQADTKSWATIMFAENDIFLGISSPIIFGSINHSGGFILYTLRLHIRHRTTIRCAFSFWPAQFYCWCCCISSSS